MACAKIAQLGSLLVSAFVIFGCAQQPTQGSDSSKPPVGGPDHTDGSWIYKSEEFGFLMKLPSSDWKKSSKNKDIATFFRQGSESPMLAGVKSAKKQTAEEFRESARQFKKTVTGTPGLGEPTYEEGKTKAGNLYSYVAMREKGEGPDSYYYVASSHVWLKDRGITVQVVFEGQGKMQSKLFQASELGQFELAAKAICLSVE